MFAVFALSARLAIDSEVGPFEGLKDGEVLEDDIDLVCEAAGEDFEEGMDVFSAALAAAGIVDSDSESSDSPPPVLGGAVTPVRRSPSPAIVLPPEGGAADDLPPAGASPPPVVAVPGVAAPAILLAEHEPVEDPPPPLLLPAGAAEPRRGWGAHGRSEPHESAEVPDHDDPSKILGKILINKHPSALSLDAHCRTCHARVNRKFKKRPGAAGEKHHQGRPMGSLLAWLHLPCDGNPAHHKNRYTGVMLPHDERRRLRLWGVALGTLAILFEKEREPRAGEPDGEPVPLS